MRNFAESILALFAGCERSATIYGDLTEMAATRGSLWFAAAYTRTLFSLTWRIVLALFVADVGRELIFNLFHLYIRYTPSSWRTANGPHLLNHAGPLLACMISTLWFALPFAAVRYGVRDPFVRFTFAIAIGVTVAFLFIPWVSLVAAAATLALACAAFLSSRWRKPFEVLAWTGAVGFLALLAVTQGRLRIPMMVAGHSLMTGNSFMLIFQTSLLLVAIVCSRMHRLLMEEAKPSGMSPAAG